MTITDIDDIKSLTITSVVWFEAPVRSEWDDRKQNEHCLAFGLTGNGVHTFKDGRILDFKKNTILYLKENDPYHVKLPDGQICIAIHFQINEKLADKSELLIPKELSSFHSLFLDIEKTYANKRNGWKLYCKGLFFQILSLIAKGKENNSLTPWQRDKIVTATEFMHKHITEFDLNIEHISNDAGISVQYFRRLFHIYHGISPIEYIRNYKIQRAKDMLHLSYLMIGDVAEKLGFPDIYYFSRVFKQVTGLTPSEYRNTL
jgi:AraC-like DNA-binding protein